MATLTLPYFAQGQAQRRMQVRATDTATRFATCIYNVSDKPSLSYPSLNPTSGEVNTTIFNFQVKYTDASIGADSPDTDNPYSGYPKMQFLLNGSVVKEVSLSYSYGYIASGATYKGSTTLQIPGNYTYRIIAMDEWGVWANPVSGSGPNVTGGMVPILSWTGELPNYGTGGVNPVIGTTGTTFTFKVVYDSQGGSPPASGYPKVKIMLGVVVIYEGLMTLVGGDGNYGTYSYQTTLATVSTDYSYSFSAFNGTLWAIGTPTQTQDNPDVIGSNIAPVLSWTQETGYTNDGVNPDNSASGSQFSFRIKYSDANNDSGSVSLILTSPSGTVSTYTLTQEGIGSYMTGVIFSGTYTLSDLGTYCHQFIAQDSKGSIGTTSVIVGTPTVLTPGILSWLGIAPYENDGLDPDTGNVGSPQFIYKVVYTHPNNKPPATNYPKVYILKGGAAYTNITMNLEGGTFTTGATYTTAPYAFSQSGYYTYYFEAIDIDGVYAQGPPTTGGVGPNVTGGGPGNAPTLSYSPLEQGTRDGIENYSGTVGTSFKYIVRYTDVDNDPPAIGYPKVEIRKNASTIIGQYTMDHIDAYDTTYSDGKDYMLSIVVGGLPGGGCGLDYAYKFVAIDTNNNSATGDPTVLRSAPEITTTPELTWSGRTPDFETDGVHPNSGAAGSKRFEVKYISSENHAPYSQYPKVNILLGGDPLSGSPFTLNQYDTGDTNYVDGKLYYKNVTINIPGVYTYYFEAEEGSAPDVMATGTATLESTLTVTGVNTPPTLNWQGTGSWASDGVDPDRGATGATYTFRIKYTDANNHPPKYGGPTLKITKGASSVSYLMTTIVEGTLTQSKKGIVYEKKIALPLFGTGTYSYAFNGSDTPHTGGGSSLNATQKSDSGPIVSTPPVLSWTGETGYGNDGVNPDSGNIGNSFTFKIKYKDADGDAPKTGSPTVHILIGEKEISGSPFSMTAESGGSYIDGKTYANTQTLTIAAIYTYWFEASDANYVATRTSLIQGPIVTGANLAPTLTLGTVTPTLGASGTTFVFSVKYTDQNNDPPMLDYPKVVVLKNGAPFETYTLTSLISGSYSSGAIYQTSTTQLTSEGNYSFSFVTYDSLEASTSTSPISNCPFVSPLTLTSGTATVTGQLATFVVTYTGNTPPANGYPRVYINKSSDGSRVHGSPFFMTHLSGNYPTGAVYRLENIALDTGEYTYWFEAKDGYGVFGTTGTGAFNVSSPAPKAPIITQNIEITKAYNYPNPMYAKDAYTTIRVEFSGTTTPVSVELNIYDVAGDLVYEREPQSEPVKHDNNYYIEILWDGRNGNGRPVANGVYFARVIVDLGHKKEARIIKIAIIR